MIEGAIVIDGDLRGGLTEVLAQAPPGTYCAVDGFREWKLTRTGWRHDVTGAVLSAVVLADLLAGAIEDGSAIPQLLEIQDTEDDESDE